MVESCWKVEELVLLEWESLLSIRRWSELDREIRSQLEVGW